MYHFKEYKKLLDKTHDELIRSQGDAVYMGFELEAAKQQYAAMVVQDLIEKYNAMVKSKWTKSYEELIHEHYK